MVGSRASVLLMLTGLAFGAIICQVLIAVNLVFLGAATYSAGPDFLAHDRDGGPPTPAGVFS